MSTDDDLGMPPPEFFEEMAKDCHCCCECSSPPCDGVCAGGMCDRMCFCRAEDFELDEDDDVSNPEGGQEQ